MKRTLHDEAPMRERGDVRCPRTSDSGERGGRWAGREAGALCPVILFCTVRCFPGISYRAGGQQEVLITSQHLCPLTSRQAVRDRREIFDRKYFPNRERIRAGRVSAFNGRSYQNYQNSAVMQRESGCDEVER